VRKAKSVANYYEKQRTSGTIGVYIRYCLLNGPKVTSYVQSLTSGHPKSSVRPVWSLVRTHYRLEAYVWWSPLVHCH
jgi:hypothetical protein